MRAARSCLINHLLSFSGVPGRFSNATHPLNAHSGRVSSLPGGPPPFRRWGRFCVYRVRRIAQRRTANLARFAWAVASWHAKWAYQRRIPSTTAVQMANVSAWSTFSFAASDPLKPRGT